VVLSSNAVESLRSSVRRYERARSAPRRCEGSARSASNRAARTPVSTLRSARLQRSATRISESSAALQTRLRRRRLQKCCASISDYALPYGTRAGQKASELSAVSWQSVPFALAWPLC
jgi:hypothetical protein